MECDFGSDARFPVFQRSQKLLTEHFVSGGYKMKNRRSVQIDQEL